MNQNGIDMIAAERMAELDAMLDANRWHPLAGAGEWSLSDEELASTLDGARISREIDIGGPVIIMFGYLSRAHGLAASGDPHAFSCVREKGDGSGRRHLLFAPTKDD